LEPNYLQGVGTFVQSVNHPTRYYFANYTSGGQQITINHTDGSQSKYMHIDSIDVSVGQQVLAGQRIGTSGNTSQFKDSYIGDLLKYFDSRNYLPDGFDNIANPESTGLYKIDPSEPGFPDDIAPSDTSGYALRPHLHFEYWETANIPEPNSGQAVSG
jgi:hypothetical protein